MTPRITALLLCLMAALPAHADPSTTTLQARELVQRALAQDPTLLSQRAEVAAAEAGVDAARAGYRPTLVLSAQEGRATRTEVPRHPLLATANDGSRPSHSQSITLSQTLYDGSRTRAEVQAAQERLAQERVRLLRRANERARGLLDAWHRWQAARSRLGHAESALGELQRLYRVMAARLDAGQSPLVDVKRAESRLLDQQRGVSDAHTALEQARLALQTLSGLPLLGVTPAPTPFAAAPAHELQRLLDQCPDTCPQVLEGELQWRRGQAELAASKAGLLPTVSLEASSSYSRNVGGSSERYRSEALYLKLNWALYEGGARQARVRQVEHNVASLAAQREDARQQAQGELLQARARYEGSLAQHRLAQQSAAVAAEARALAEQGFQAGRRSAIEVADTVTEATRAQDEVASRDAERHAALDQFHAVSGTLLSRLGIDMPPVGIGP